MKRVFDKNDKAPGEKPSLNDTLQVLETVEGDIVPAGLYYGLSGLDASEIEQVKPIWEKLAREFRRKLMLDLAESSESNFEFDYRALGLLGLTDSDAGVRSAAIETLWIDETLEVMAKLIDLTQWDESREVRAAAVGALGHFILLGEYGDIPEQEGTRAQEIAIGLWTDEGEDMEVRRRALEAISNSGHEIVEDAIREAYESGEHLLLVSALFAMGRTCDSQWGDTILKEMRNSDAEIRYEAARAAGELELEAAVQLLGELSVTDEREIQEVSVWSLGEIGGREALRILTALAQDAEEAKDVDLLEAIEDAMSNASLLGELFGLDFSDN